MDIQVTEQLLSAAVHAHTGYDTPVQALDAQASKRPPCGSDAHDRQTQRNADLDTLARPFVELCSRVACLTG